MNQHRDDDELMALLGEAFPTTALAPDAKARQHLLDALALDNVVAFDANTPASRRRRLLGSRVSALTLGVAGVLSLGGVAAAAVATNTLPGPTRAIAYDLGLPVTSPALYQARAQLHNVNAATSGHHTNVARELAKGLIKDLKLLNQNDLSQIRPSVKRTLSQLGLLSQVTSVLGTTVTNTTSTTFTNSGPTNASTTTTTTTTTTTATTTTPVLVPPTLPSVGSITGSGGLGGVVNNTTSGTSSLLP